MCDKITYPFPNFNGCSFGYLFSSHTLLGIWLLIHSGIKVNLCYSGPWQVVHGSDINFFRFFITTCNIASTLRYDWHMVYIVIYIIRSTRSELTHVQRHSAAQQCKYSWLMKLDTVTSIKIIATTEELVNLTLFPFFKIHHCSYFLSSAPPLSKYRAPRPTTPIHPTSL